MKYGKNANGFSFNSNLLDMRKENIHKCHPGQYSVKRSILYYLIIAGLTLFLSAESSIAQFLVQPTSIGLNINPRTKYETVLSVHNFDTQQDMKIDFKVLELTQKDTGDWLPFSTDPCDPIDYYLGMDLTKVSSCSSWVQLDANSLIVPRDGDAKLRVTINTPFRIATGFYGAVIMASTRLRSVEDSQVDTIIRSGVPILANVNATRQIPKVEIEDVGMEFVPSVGLEAGRVLATMKIKNSGKGFSTLRPFMRIRGLINGHWAVITSHEFQELGILPGVELNLKSDIEKSLPSGTYQLDGVLYVDDIIRKGCRFAKQIEFKGDPLISRAAKDVPLDLEPREIIISVSPGQTRYEYLSVHNATQEQIEIQPILDIPKHFKDAVVNNNVMLADELTCAKWLSFEPSSFKLGGYGNRNIQISAAMPEDAIKYPCYFGVLGLKAVYPDGQVAGTTWLNICVQNKNDATQAEISKPTIILGEINAETSQYAIQAIFQNGGNVYAIPTSVKAVVIKADGYGRTGTILRSDKFGMLLPYEKRTYNGILNFSSVLADDYNLEVRMDCSSGQSFFSQARISVAVAGEKRIPKIIETNVKDPIVVKW